MRTRLAISAVSALGVVAGAAASFALPAPARADATPFVPAINGAVVPLAQAGVLTAWPASASGQGETTVPAALQNVPVTAISTSSTVALALTADGTLVPWGASGDIVGVIPTHLDPTTVVQVLASRANGAAVVTSDGKVQAWSGAGADSVWVTGAAALSNVERIAAGTGAQWGVALLKDGTLRAWGGNLATGNVANAPTTLAGVTDIAACAQTGFAVTSDGALTTWGSDGGSIRTDAPTSGIKSVACSANAGYAIKTDGSLVSWGSASNTGFEIPASLTAAVSGGAKITSITGSGAGVAATADNGAVWAWGDTALAAEPTPAGLAGAGVSAIAAGGGAAYALAPKVLVAAKPTIAGTAKVGQVLTATDASFSGGGTVSGQWLRVSGATSTPIANATSVTYTPTSADAGKTLVYRSTSTKSGSTAVSADSDATAAVEATAPPASSVTVAAPAARYGKAATVTVKVASSGAVSGNVAVTLDGKALKTVALASGAAVVALPATLNAGRHTVTASYAGNGTSAAASASAAITVAKATSTTKVKLPKTAKKGKKVKAVVTVATSGGTATGTVTVKIGKAKGTGVVKGGKATVTIKLAKKKGKQAVSVTYAGNANTTGSSAKGSLKVK
jgi:hypothetical protein